MAIRKVMRAGKPVLFIDIRYRSTEGKKRRFRRDAQVQTLTAARAEERRLLAYLAEHGTLPLSDETLDGGGKLVEPAVPPPPTFGEAVENFRRTALLALKPNTRRGYEEILDGKHVAPLLKRPLPEIGLAAFADLDARLSKAEVSASRRRNVHAAARSVLRAAVAGGLLPDMPKLPPLPRVGRTEPAVFPEEELARFLEASPPQARLAFALSAYAGLRAGEVRGLRWGDVDLKSCSLVVRRGLAMVTNEAAAPKSGHERRIPLATPLLALLKGAKQGKPDDPVVLDGEGKAWSYDGLRSAFRRGVEKAGLTAMGLHSLRHAFVTSLFRRQVAAPVVQRLAGHGSLAVTQRYAHVAGDELRAAIGRLG